jgi:hypothetical protein
VKEEGSASFSSPHWGSAGAAFHRPLRPDSAANKYLFLSFFLVYFLPFSFLLNVCMSAWLGAIMALGVRPCTLVVLQPTLFARCLPALIFFPFLCPAFTSLMTNYKPYTNTHPDPVMSVFSIAANASRFAFVIFFSCVLCCSFHSFNIVPFVVPVEPFDTYLLSVSVSYIS